MITLSPSQSEYPRGASVNASEDGTGSGYGPLTATASATLLLVYQGGGNYISPLASTPFLDEGGVWAPTVVIPADAELGVAWFQMLDSELVQVDGPQFTIVAAGSAASAMGSYRRRRT